jgi:hypothetical protein
MAVAKYAFGEQESSRQLGVAAGGSHRDGDRREARLVRIAPLESDLERLLDGEQVCRQTVAAAALDLDAGNAFHARAPHQYTSEIDAGQGPRNVGPFARLTDGARFAKMAVELS